MGERRKKRLKIRPHFFLHFGNRVKLVKTIKMKMVACYLLGLAENVVKRITDQPAEVTEYVDKREKETAPLPYSLSALQIDAAKRFGMSAQSVLDTCQRLYETHPFDYLSAF